VLNVTPTNGEETVVVVLNEDGEEVAQITVPDGVDGVVVVTKNDGADSINDLSSIVLDISIFDANGERITDFEDDLQICFRNNGDDNDVCLGFFNEDGNWECEDFCLEPPPAGSLLCGETDHLTNFALLLSTDANSDARCGSSDSADLIFLYLTIGFVTAAICFMCIGFIIIEYRVRRKAAKKEAAIRRVTDHVMSNAPAMASSRSR